MDGPLHCTEFSFLTQEGMRRPASPRGASSASGVSESDKKVCPALFCLFFSTVRKKKVSSKASVDGGVIVHDVLLTDEKGKVIGTEKRTFLVEERGTPAKTVFEGEVSTPEDEERAKRFAEQVAGKKGKEAILALAELTHKELEGLRVAWRRRRKDALSTFIREQMGASSLANFAIALLAPPAEFCADELHIGCMGLNDNQGAVFDVVGASSPEFLAQINHVFGIKYGDGRYEQKSSDGKGDVERMTKDVSAAVQANGASNIAKLRSLWSSLIRSSAATAAPFDESLLSLQKEQVDVLLKFLEQSSLSERARLVAALGGETAKVSQYCALLAAGDLNLQKALFSVILSAARHLYWLERIQDCNAGYSFNKKLFLRIACLNSPQERVALAAAYAQLSPLGGLQAQIQDPSFSQDEQDIIRALFQLK